MDSEACVNHAINLVGSSMDAEYLDQQDRANYAAQAQVWATLALVPGQPRPAKVWVATVTDDDNDYGRPSAIYVSDTQENLVTVMRKQQGIPAGKDELEWFEAHGKVAVWEPYYVETGDE